MIFRLNLKRKVLFTLSRPIYKHKKKQDSRLNYANTSLHFVLFSPNMATATLRVPPTQTDGINEEKLIFLR